MSTFLNIILEPKKIKPDPTKMEVDGLANTMLKVYFDGVKFKSSEHTHYLRNIDLSHGQFFIIKHQLA